MIQEIIHYIRGSCFTGTLSTALGVSEAEVLKITSQFPETMFRAYYSAELITTVLFAMDLDFTITKTPTYEEWKETISSALEHDEIVIVAYNAKQGEILVDKKPIPQSGHFAEILSVEGDLFTGRQSNVDGEKRKALVDKDLRLMFESSKSINSLRVDYGKLNKCKITIPKHDVEIMPRCGMKETCPMTGSRRCRFVADAGQTVITIKRKAGDA